MLAQLVALLFLISKKTDLPRGGTGIVIVNTMVSAVLFTQLLQLAKATVTAAVWYLFKQVCWKLCWRLATQYKLALLVLLEQILVDPSIKLLTNDSDRVFSVLVVCVVYGVVTSPFSVPCKSCCLSSSTSDCSEIY